MSSLRTAAYRGRKRLRLGMLRMMQLAFGLPEVSLQSIVGGDVPVHAPILEGICLPPYYGSKDHDDYSALMKLARWRKPAVILELGTAHGNTVANLCHHCPEAKIFTVNAPVEKQTGTYVTFELSEKEIGWVYRQTGFASQVVQIFENTLSLDLSRHLSGPVVDFCIIDACHDREYVLNDFEKVRPFVNPGGVVLFHDTHPSLERHLKGSYAACMELRRRGFDIKHVQNTWWAIWCNPRG